jgi:hypothetical protein
MEVFIMAFGAPTREQEVKEQGTKTFDDFRVDLKTQGIRLIRLFPIIDEEGNLVDAQGAPSERGETANEVKFAELWWKLKDVNLRIITTWAKAWRNPFYNYLKTQFEKDDPNGPKPRLKFAVNVYDRSPVIITEEGIATQNQNREFVLSNGKKVTGTPQALNRVRVLEGSDNYDNPNGEPGKHMRGKLAGLYDTVHRGDQDDLFAEPDPYLLHEFDIKLKIEGAGMKIERGFFPGSNTEPLPKSVLLLPRYNLTEWLTPWPDEMLQRLADGEDPIELRKEYKIQMFPQLEKEAEFK